MTPGRYNFLSSYANVQLTPEEKAEGWHFCPDWDGMLIHPGDAAMDGCTCKPNAAERDPSKEKS